MLIRCINTFPHWNITVNDNFSRTSIILISTYSCGDDLNSNGLTPNFDLIRSGKMSWVISSIKFAKLDLLEIRIGPWLFLRDDWMTLNLELNLLNLMVLF